jgi:hypothetical protein
VPGEPGQAVADGGEHVRRAAVEFHHVPFGGRAGGKDLGDRHPAAANCGLRVLPGHRAVLHVQIAHAVTEAAEQFGHVLPADRRPVGIDLEDHRRVERVREDLKTSPASNERRQLEFVVVVAEPQPVVRGFGRGIVQLMSERGDSVGVSESFARHRGHDHRAAAHRLGPAQQHVGVFAEGLGVHGTHGQAGLAQVGAQPFRVGPHVVGFDRAVPEGGDAPQDRHPARRELLADRVKLQGRRTANQRATLLARN